MSRSIFVLADVFSAPGLLLVDSAVKGTALLILAAVVTILLRRDSAATRHFVWLLAIVAMLVVPVLSVMLPQWRVLPEWASIQRATAVVTFSPPAIAAPAIGAVELPQSAAPNKLESPSAPLSQAVVAPTDSRPAPVTLENIPASADWTWNWQSALPMVWAIGFCALILRLVAARWVLWSTGRQGTVIWSSRQQMKATHDPIVAAHEAMCLQLGIGRPVTLLIHPNKLIPVVWGILRCRLLLPEAARHWSGEQLRSVLLHELAHIKRRDTTAQLLAQIACALHWFNPLVWFAAWRLGVERERACDDLVLASGVRPSAYAGHLLDVVTGLSPGRWTQTCGLAMARSKSLEGRLVAVLSENQSRRGVSVALAAIALGLAIGIAVPIAMLRAADEKPAAPVQQPEPKPDAQVSHDSQKAGKIATLPGRLFVSAGLRTTKDEKHFSQSAIAIDPNTGSWSRLQNLNKNGFTFPLSPVRVSPDGRTMLFIREKDIWKCDAITGENPVRVFEKGQLKAWTPDGNEFIAVVEKEAGGTVTTENWRVSADGKKKSVLSLADGDVVEDWSTDGGWLLGWSHADGQLYVMKPDGSSRKQLTKTVSNASRNEHPRFSPDGRRIVYLQTLYQGSNDAPGSRYSLRVMNVDGTDNREILGETAAKPASGKDMWTAPMGARWAPDGKHLAVVLFDHKRREGMFAINGNWRLVIINADGGNLRELKLEGVLTTVLPWDGPEWRPTAATVETRESKQGAKLQPGLEERLQWGEPVKGLRAALVRPTALGEPEAHEVFDFKIVLQNVSDAPIRFDTTSAGPKNPFFLVRRQDGSPLLAFTGTRPTPVDVVLQPREVAVMRMFPESTEGDSIVKDDPSLTFSVRLEVENAPAGAWTGKLVTGEMTAAYAGHGLLPKNKDAQRLFKIWNGAARRNEKIPGALIGLLADGVTNFTKLNPTWETTPQLLKMVPRLNASRDWSGQEALALLDELAALQDSPIGMALDADYQRTIQTGAPLPPQLADAPWGETHSSGLRLAYLLEPRAAEQPLNTPLTGRLLIHNAGKAPVVFRMWTWHQCGHKATDAKGANIEISSTEWTTLGRLVPVRLVPGEFVEVSTAGIGVGANKDAEDWRNTRVGSWIAAKAGDDVTVTTEPVPLREPYEKPDAEARWWLDLVTARLSRQLPLPADAEARKLLLYRVAMELFGTPVSEEINAAFVADREPTAIDSLAKRLADRPGITAYTGSLQSGPTRFRVLPADPDAAKKPRVASNPGWYTLGENIRLEVSRRPVGERLVNEASILFFSPDPKADAPGKPVKIKLPDGYNTWAAGWVRGGKVLWVKQKSGIRSYDFTNPAQVKKVTFEEPANFDQVPKSILDAVPAVLDVPGVRRQPPAAEKEAQ